MPHKITQTVEYCWPCIWHEQHMVMSGREPIHERTCTHPLVRTSHYNPGGDFLVGRSISDEYRPEWCPIRGDAQAEKEAEGNTT